MSCMGYCFLGSAFLGASIFTSVSTTKHQKFKNFLNTLDNNQKKKYKKIIKERLNIYITGLIISFILTYILTKNMKKSSYRFCSRIAISIMITHLYYNLYPKSDYMLNHLNNKTQNKAWLEIYKHMKFRCHIGFIFGMISYILIYYGLEF